MNLPDGMEGSDDECLLLLKALSGLVQGACQWWKKFIAILKNIKFKGGFADPCLMIKCSNDGTVFASIYIDNNFCVGNTKAGAQDLCRGPQEARPYSEGVGEANRLSELLDQVLSRQEECMGRAATPHCQAVRKVWTFGQPDAELLHSWNPWPENCQGSRRLDEDSKGRPEALSFSSGNTALPSEVFKTLPGEPIVQTVKGP